MSIKYVEDPSEFLIRTGLLFEINRTILHPLGLALSLQAPNTESEARRMSEEELQEFGLWDYREDKEGMLFTEETFKEGKEKWEKFMLEFGLAKHKQRGETLGFIYQNEEDSV